MAKGTGINRYLIQRKGLNGWYFLRRVPLDLVKPLGKRQWRQKAGNSLAEAKRAAVVLLGQTEEQIARERAKLHGGAYERAEVELMGYSPELIQELGVTNAVDQAARLKNDQYVQVSPDEWEPNPDYEHLSDLATQIKEGHLTDPKSVDEVVDQAVRLGGLAQKTEANYRRHGREFMDFCGKRYVGQVNSQDAKKIQGQ